MKRTAISLVVLAVAAALYLLAEYRPPEPGTAAPQPSAQGAPPPAAAVSLGEEWSDTDPAINLEHIFHGEINRRGKPVGFHSRPGGEDPEGARVVRIRDEENEAGEWHPSASASAAARPVAASARLRVILRRSVFSQ